VGKGAARAWWDATGVPGGQACLALQCQNLLEGTTEITWPCLSRVSADKEQAGLCFLACKHRSGSKGFALRRQAGLKFPPEPRAAGMGSVVPAENLALDPGFGS